MGFLDFGVAAPGNQLQPIMLQSDFWLQSELIVEKKIHLSNQFKN